MVCEFIIIIILHVWNQHKKSYFLQMQHHVTIIDRFRWIILK